jgi:hypothetical protein
VNRAVTSRATAVAVLLTLGCTQPAANPGPPRGGEKLLPAAETAAAVVVGRMEDIEQIDSHGYAAQLNVERSLLASPPASRLRVAWEELAKSRKPRFEAGDGVLIAVSQLPNASLWDQRFPGARADGSVLAVAANGDAYMHSPDGETIGLLEGYLRLAADQRDKVAGVELLAQIAASAAPGVASSAVQRLNAVAGLENIPPDSLRTLGAALDDERRPQALRLAIIDLIGTKKLGALRPQVDALSERASPLQAPALAAIAVLEGGLSAQRAAELLSSSDPAVRAIAVRFATGAEVEQHLATLVKYDPAAEVRGAAAAALIQRRGIYAFDDVVPALADADASARLAAIEAVGKLGADVVPALSALTRDGSLEEATGAVLTLDRCGPSGKAALIAIAADHPDERVRRLAMLALGKLGGHEH